jgi:DNA-binding NtrC family response regulator
MSEKNILEGKKILLVDDESDVLDTLEDLLDICEVKKASNFYDAKNLLETEIFDIAILDIMGVSGYELLKIAKEKNVVAIMLTANALSLEDTVKSYKEGAASFVPKEEMLNIDTFLNDILEAKERGKNFWWRWLDRLDLYYANRFGSDWQKNDKEFWEKLKYKI